MKSLVVICLLSNLSFGVVTAEELLNASDRTRGSAASTEGVSWRANVNSIENGETIQATYLIKARGNNAIAEVINPPRQKGETILFNDRVLWFYKPGLKKPVSISARQKLMGQASNGDIASTHYARDYEGKILGEEKIGSELSYKLELKAKTKNVTYDKITYWISKSKQLGVKAEFLTLNGEVFKTADFNFGNTISISGKSLPFISQMTIRDFMNKNNKTSIDYIEPKEAKQDPGIFNVNNLLR